ncbi:MAG: tRNA (adenosine(37)-N6)-threonylcarbamoyltransferase complex dimerization subunit type 1 TsaB [Bacteroidales bacterium]|jgi:tRNA threonylcarbamoyladenosine biosynthesis protein TsaB|nr:tRNA (adenosine(37)-N6)-threonylcarbamoyltransferase complex dimerization subunit type 1 TsaB [Bacteroidales bacterium]
MPRILYIESATSVCSVVLAEGESIISVRESQASNSHSELLTDFIYQILKENSFKVDDLDAVAVSKGPGSYTGLRIGVSAAKGLCYSANIPLIAVDTLCSMAYGAENPHINTNFYCPMIDARRMEVYTALYDSNIDIISNIEAKVIDENSFQDILRNDKILFFGDGMPKCKNFIKSANAIFDDNYVISAKSLIKPALNKFEVKDFEDIAYFEPFYLKDFIAGKPSVKALYE